MAGGTTQSWQSKRAAAIEAGMKAADLAEKEAPENTSVDGPQEGQQVQPAEPAQSGPLDATQVKAPAGSSQIPQQKPDGKPTHNASAPVVEAPKSKFAAGGFDKALAQEKAIRRQKEELEKRQAELAAKEAELKSQRERLEKAVTDPEEVLRAAGWTPGRIAEWQKTRRQRSPQELVESSTSALQAQLKALEEKLENQTKAVKVEQSWNSALGAVAADEKYANLMAVGKARPDFLSGIKASIESGTDPIEAFESARQGLDELLAIVSPNAKQQTRPAPAPSQALSSAPSGAPPEQKQGKKTRQQIIDEMLAKSNDWEIGPNPGQQ
jgi:hypothetical protein